MAVLDWALQHEFLISLALRAWRIYLQHVDPGTLAGNLSQVAVTVLLATKTDPVGVAAVLTYLLQEKAVYLGRAVRELAFLPLDQPEIAGVRGIIRDFCGPPADLEESLPALLQILAHDHPRVCILFVCLFVCFFSLMNLLGR